MRTLLALLVSAAWIAVAASADFASADDRNNDHRRSMGNLRPDHRTAGPAIQGSPPPRSERHRRWRPSHPVRPGYHPHYGHGYGYYYPPGYVYDPYYVYPPPYPPYSPYYWRYPPPVYLPAETLYGPEAVKRFMGADRMQSAANPQVIIIGGDDDEDDEPAPPPHNARTVELAWRFIGFGDAHFANQRYADAQQRYRRAAAAAPTVADAYFRQGYALAALGNYDQAARVLKRGLELHPDWARSDFRNDELYGDNQAAKQVHLDALTQAADENPNDADLLFLVGVFLHFDGQRDRALPFFQRAAGIAGAGDDHVRGFLAPADPPEDRGPIR
jgi:hypothetical protein